MNDFVKNQLISKHGNLTVQEIYQKIIDLEIELFKLNPGEIQGLDISSEIYSLTNYLEEIHGVVGDHELETLSHFKRSIVKMARNFLKFNIYNHILSYTYNGVILDSLIGKEDNDPSLITQDLVRKVVRDTIMFYGVFNPRLSEEQISNLKIHLEYGKPIQFSI